MDKALEVRCGCSTEVEMWRKAPWFCPDCGSQDDTWTRVAEADVSSLVLCVACGSRSRLIVNSGPLEGHEEHVADAVDARMATLNGTIILAREEWLHMVVALDPDCEFGCDPKKIEDHCPTHNPPI